MGQENQQLKGRVYSSRKCFPARKTGGSAADVTVKAWLQSVNNPRNFFPLVKLSTTSPTTDLQLLEPWRYHGGQTKYCIQ